jgi:spore coat protein U-like protein
MNRVMKSLIALATFTLAIPMFAAATQKTSDITATASVSPICTIITDTNLDFGSYDPVLTNASAAKVETTPAVVKVSCTKKTPSVYVDFATSAGTMTFSTDTLNFNLYADSGRTLLFGSGNTFAPLNFDAAKDVQSVTIYGKIPGGQDVQAGSFSGTVTARVNY